MSLFPEFGDSFEAAQSVPQSSDSASAKAPPGPDARRRFREIQRNQPSWMLVDLERMLDESHPARAIWDFVGGLDLSGFEAKVRSVEGRAGRDA